MTEEMKGPALGVHLREWSAFERVGYDEQEVLNLKRALRKVSSEMTLDC